MKLRGMEGPGGWAAAAMVRSWMETLDVQVRYADERLDPAHPHCNGRGIYVFWHEYILAPLAFRNRCGLAMLLSRHRDADVLFRVGGLMGFDLIRGSTNRGGAAALRALLDHGQSSHIAITPDGPRGPRRKLAAGAVFLASKIGLPVIPLGLGYDRPWRLPTWDRFAIPRPFSRVRAVLGEAIAISGSAGREELERKRTDVESALLDATARAEQWAERGDRSDADFPARRRDLRRAVHVRSRRRAWNSRSQPAAESDLRVENPRAA